MPIEPLRLAQLVQQAGGYPHQARQVAVPIEQHGKLIARQPRHGIRLGNGADNAPGNLVNQLIGQFMAQAFVEQLETVQIDMQQGKAAAVAAYPLRGFLQAQPEQ